MNPRLKSSTKWTELPDELHQQIEDVYRENFKDFLGGKSSLIIGSKVFKSELLLWVGYKKLGKQLKQSNFKASVDYDSETDKLIEITYVLVDCIASMMNEYFTKNENDLSLPVEWVSFDVDTKEIFLQYSTKNTSLEKKADKLLGLLENEESLVKGEEADDDESELAVIKGKLGIE